jgi:hypothetical protein
MNLIPGAGLIFLIHFLYAHARFQLYSVCSLEKNMCLAAATGTVSPPIFRLRSAHPQKRQIKTYIPVFRVMCGRPQAFYRDLRSATIVVYGGQRIKFLFIIANVNFSKIVAFKGTIRKFLNTAAVHIEGLRHPPMCLFDTLSCVSVPLLESLRFIIMWLMEKI